MSASPKIWIVCPCYFDAPSFLRVREEAMAALQEAIPSARITFLVVDDAAGQDPEVDARLVGLGNVTVICPPRNLGHQGALVYGLRWAGTSIPVDDMVVTMDSDGEDRPADIAALIAPLRQEAERLDLVAVARRTKRTESALFQLCYFCFKVFFRITTGTVIRSGNFVAYRGQFLKEIIHHPYFDQCYSATFISLPLSLKMVPLPRGRRYAGTSKMGAWGLFAHGLRMLLPFKAKIARRGIFVFSIMALIFAGFMAAGRRGGQSSVDSGAAIGLGAALVLLAVSVLALVRARRAGRGRRGGVA